MFSILRLKCSVIELLIDDGAATSVEQRGGHAYEVHRSMRILTIMTQQELSRIDLCTS